MPIIRLNGGEVSYQVDGEPGKPWLMFSNSLGTDLRMWQAQAEFFKQDFRVLRYDTRGHGGSTIGPAAAAAAAVRHAGHDAGPDVGPAAISAASAGQDSAPEAVRATIAAARAGYDNAPEAVRAAIAAARAGYDNAPEAGAASIAAARAGYDNAPDAVRAAIAAARAGYDNAPEAVRAATAAPAARAGYDNAPDAGPASIAAACAGHDNAPEAVPAASAAARASVRLGHDDAGSDVGLAGRDAGLRSGSDVGREPVSLALLGRDVLALLDALAIERVHFCGLSMGGAIAQWLGIHAPQRLHKLVIANSAPRIGTAQGWQDRSTLVRASGLDAIADGAAGRWFTPAFAEREPRRVTALVVALRAGSPEGYAACCDALAVADLRGQLATIAVPTLLIAGAADPVTTVADATAMREQIPGATLAILDASHISNIEAEAAFNLALREFLHS
ncbi:alpha/beta fold hydrolase [Duganella aceris]|uniref:Alpha/beta fold hydrolase n=1 Tax=Duganella aceris TaxID=2703883 RepID=A0ABX0FI33_9BURK|nr:alpha/beta fold hydrolase [Duganella aceris]NGZ84250.1 alpha/beta fold hydrolase [Duganella aceris]